MPKSKLEDKLASRASTGGGRPEYVYGDDGEFEVLAVCARAGLPDIVVKLTYPTARRWADGTVTRIPWTADKLRDAMLLDLPGRGQALVPALAGAMAGGPDDGQGAEDFSADAPWEFG